MASGRLPTAGSSQPPQGGERHLVVFRLEGALFGLEILQVHRVLVPPPLVAVPGAPPEVRGIFDLHGVLVAVLDTMRLLHRGRKRLGNDARASVATNRLVVVRAGEERLVALEVDDVLERTRLSGKQSMPPPPEVEAPAVIGAFYRGEELGLVLDAGLLVGEVASMSWGAAEDD